MMSSRTRHVERTESPGCLADVSAESTEAPTSGLESVSEESGAESDELTERTFASRCLIFRSATRCDIMDTPKSRLRRRAASGPGPAAPASAAEPLVICAGVMMAGQETLKQALRILMPDTKLYSEPEVAEHSKLWDRVMHGEPSQELLLTALQGYGLAIGAPASAFWEDLYAARKSKVILLQRDERRWWDCVYKGRQEGVEAAFRSPLMTKVEEFCMPTFARFARVMRCSYTSLIGGLGCDGTLVESVARSSVRAYNNYVKTTVPEDDLLVYDCKLGWGPLCEFLGVPVPAVSFPEAEPAVWAPKEIYVDTEGPVAGEMRSALARVGAGVAGILALLVGIAISTMVSSPAVAVISAVVGFQMLAAVVLAMRKAQTVLPAVNLSTKTLRIVGVFLALNVVLVLYGVVKEALVTRDRASIAVLMLLTRGSSALAAAVMMKMKYGRISFGVPWHQFTAFAVTNELSTWASYEMLKYVSFPVQTMAKSCVILPSMVMGFCMNGTRYSLWEYVQTAAVVIGVGIMQMEHSSGKNSKGGGEGGMLMGVSLLVFFFACDAFTSQYQTKLYKRFKCNQYQLMLGGNLAGCVLTLLANAHHGQQLVDDFCATLSGGVAIRALALGVLGIMGQMLIYYTIREFGAVVFAWITTARKLVSVVVSIVVFGHGVTATKVSCISVAFAVIANRVREGKKA
mmetsp:Transcript_37329/g.89771  ORF Transcript_37329/g.89771 Transcript_37329/m.89771 type:complete len:687 (-) Transcript_37329:1105-3165(-)